MLLFHIERIRFFLWCDYVGITNLVLILDSGGTGDCHNELLNSPKSSVLTQEWTLKFLCDILEKIQRNFYDARSLLGDHTNPGKPAILTRLIAKSSGDDKRLVSIAFDDAPSSRPRNGRKNRGVSFNVAWVFSNKRKFKAFVSNLQQYNDGLRSILSGIEMLELQRQKELLATTSSFGSLIVACSTIANVPNTAQRSTAMQRLVELTERSSIINQHQFPDPNSELLLSESNITPPIELYILRSDIELPNDHNSELLPRISAKYKGEPALIEWRYYSRRLTPEMFAYMRQRVTMLILQLQQSSSTEGFSILECVGHFEDLDNYRIGMVFKTPNTLQGDQITNLRDIMVKDRRDRIARELGARMSVARPLVMTVFRLHSVGWLHKNFRSENILLKKLSGDSCFELGNPYVCGFDFSRQDMPYELMERVPTQLQYQYLSRERSLYRHPDLHYKTENLSEEREEDGEKAEEKLPRHRKSYDMYSLGVVLLEIGLWYPIKHLVKNRESPQEFHQRLLSELLPELRYRMGRRYHDVVAKCLWGHFSGEDGMDSTGISSDDHQVRSKRFLESFLKDAVVVLEGISI